MTVKQRVSEVCKQGTPNDSVDWVNSLQVSGRIAKLMNSPFGIELKRVFLNADRFGNSGFAAIWPAFAELRTDLTPVAAHEHLVAVTDVVKRYAGSVAVEQLSLYADLPVLENLRFCAEVDGVEKTKMAALAVIEDFQLTPYRKSGAKRL